MHFGIARVLAALAALSAGACAGSGHQLPKITDVERAAARAEIAAAPGPSPSGRITTESERMARQALSRVQGAAQPVCIELGRDDCWYTLTYSHTSEVNAGIVENHMVFFDGLGQYLESDEEFAAVISHEIGHHLADHHKERLRNRLAGAIIAGLLAGALGGSSDSMDSAMRLGASIGDISYSKEHEAEADYLASYLMTRAGYDPEMAAHVWIKLAKISGRTRTGLLDTHPAGPDRLAAWRRSIEEVRYSADLLPNPEGADEEPRLEVARAFGVGPDAEDGGLAVAAAVPGSAPGPAPSGMAPPPPADALSLVESGTRAGRDFVARMTWIGLTDGGTGRLTFGSPADDRGVVELSLEETSSGGPARCRGRWTRKQEARRLTIGAITLDCGQGRVAEGGYRLQSDGSKGFAGLKDAEGALVQIELTAS